MSRVVITDLVPGTEATSTGVNETIDSWNAAAGAGDIGANNVRQEGIDRRTLSDAAQAIQAPPASFGNCIASGSTETSNAIAAAWALVNVGSNLSIGPMTDLSSSSSEMVTIRASLWFSGPAMDAGVSPALYEFIIQSSTDAVTWVDYDASYQAFKITAFATGVRPRCTGTYTSLVSTTPAGSRVYWRVAYRAPEAVLLGYGTLYIEEYAR